jgi:hypothetical protein
MYADLGIHWASSVPAFLALACVPFPFFFYKYGTSIRSRCKYAAQAAHIMEDMRNAARETELEGEREDRERRGEQAQEMIITDDSETTIALDENILETKAGRDEEKIDQDVEAIAGSTKF